MLTVRKKETQERNILYIAKINNKDGGSRWN